MASSKLSTDTPTSANVAAKSPILNAPKAPASNSSIFTIPTASASVSPSSSSNVSASPPVNSPPNSAYGPWILLGRQRRSVRRDPGGSRSEDPDPEDSEILSEASTIDTWVRHDGSAAPHCTRPASTAALHDLPPFGCDTRTDRHDAPAASTAVLRKPLPVLSGAGSLPRGGKQSLRSNSWIRKGPGFISPNHCNPSATSTSSSSNPTRLAPNSDPMDSSLNNDGDHNTTYFHRVVSSRRCLNKVNSITLADGSVVFDNIQILHAFSYAYSTIWSNLNCQFVDISDAFRFPRLNDCDRASLIAPFSLSEVWNVVKWLPNGKSPGLDGFTGEFYMHYWPILSNPFMKCLTIFHNTAHLPFDWNKTILSFIPKCPNPSTVEDFRPIAPCNLNYRILAKTSVNRLSSMLPKLVSLDQSAFIKGRSIHDDILVAQELAHSMYGSKGKNPYILVRIDIEKAFDKLS
ncbi:hypothetical protein Cni_G22337 [Canna indica]|uniref:Reverse transcriptase domain-containing protein n=1 Tax=Canna indica TaxID=4628 RepID=A0AAQ3KU21_9LILI|nr:hypothetical protein Cni_G22337 [Canna indica]